jgi:spermidine synthase
MLPVACTDPRLPVGHGLWPGIARALLGLFGFCASLGFITPFLTDRWSQGEPRRVGSAYALNVLGCILGPLVTGFALLPWLGEKGSLVALAAPLLLLGTAGALLSPKERGAGLAWSGLAAVVLAVALLLGRSFESLVPGAIVRRDSTATVAAIGHGMRRQILVNGIGMTHFTPITKMMAHLPLAFRERPAERALIICFGMGTSYRSSLSWGVATTAIELVPSVPTFFPEFYPDGAAILASPLGRIVVDDGRRFLERSTESYGAIVIDPPPPLTAAGSSLLYSREFCQVLRRRLAAGGIVAQWIPGGEEEVVAAILRALTDSFPHVRTFTSVEGWGLHILASEDPIPEVPGSVLASRLPERAVADLLEWSPGATAEGHFERVVSQEIPVGALLRPGVAALTDDRPVNEYYFLRETLGR